MNNRLSYCASFRLKNGQGKVKVEELKEFRHQTSRQPACGERKTGGERVFEWPGRQHRDTGTALTGEQSFLAVQPQTSEQPVRR